MYVYEWTYVYLNGLVDILCLGCHSLPKVKDKIHKPSPTSA